MPDQLRIPGPTPLPERVVRAMSQAMIDHRGPEFSAMHKEIAAGVRDANRVKAAAIAEIPNVPALKLEYLEIVEPDEMQPVDRIDGPVCVAGALWVGSTRLIDNLRCTPSE